MCIGKKTAYIQIFEENRGAEFLPFHLYLPAGDRYYAQYRFVYVCNPIDPTLTFAIGPNNTANSHLYRIHEVYMGTLEGETFAPAFRALQHGEIGLAFREEGAGDFAGGIHGDEVMDGVSLTVDGVSCSLNRPFFGSFETLSFRMDSCIFRCNTPQQKLVRHQQEYTVADGKLCLAQRIRWIGDALPLQAAFSPMLTAQRLDPAQPERILTDTVEFYAQPDGALLATVDTSACGRVSKKPEADRVYLHTPAAAVKVYGKTSGFAAEAGYRILNDSIPPEQRQSHLWIRYGDSLDNKIYFNIGKNAAPKAGTVWESDIYYRMTYSPKPE